MSVRKFNTKRARGSGSSSGGAKGRSSGSSVRKLPKRFSTTVVSSNRRRNTTTAGFIGIEHKFFDTFLVDAVIANSDDGSGGVVDPSASVIISSPPQGSGPSDRDGKKILIESISISGNVSFAHNSSASLKTMPIIYVALVMDTQTNGASMTSELALQNLSGTLSMAANPMKNLLRSTRFQTLKVWEMQPLMPAILGRFDANTYETMGFRIPFDLFKKVSIPVNFNGAGVDANVANVSDNSLHMIAFSSLAAFAKISYHCRIRFVG